jgi:hypothetical protein
MGDEPTGERKFAEFVSYHVFGNENREMGFSVVYAEGVSDEFGNDRARAGPGLDDGLAAGSVERVDLLEELGVHVGSLLDGTGHTVSK